MSLWSNSSVVCLGHSTAAGQGDTHQQPLKPCPQSTLPWPEKLSTSSLPGPTTRQAIHLSLFQAHLQDSLSALPSSCLGQLSFLAWTMRLVSLPNAKHAVDVVPDASLEDRGFTALPLGHGTALQTINHPKLLIQEMPNVRVEPVDQREAMVFPGVILLSTARGFHNHKKEPGEYSQDEGLETLGCSRIQ